MIKSHLLYQLSYRGVASGGILLLDRTRIKRLCKHVAGQFELNWQGSESRSSSTKQSLGRNQKEAAKPRMAQISRIRRRPGALLFLRPLHLYLTFDFFACGEDFQRQAAESRRRKESRGHGILMLKRLPTVNGLLRRRVTQSAFSPWRPCIKSDCVSPQSDSGCGVPALGNLWSVFCFIRVRQRLPLKYAQDDKSRDLV